ncbi:1-acyl-sn-glycerol-3-phosphate acyltransferase [bacterium SCSIO 12643]|nr:1-acyl-sn-glycerol-3-phosphate acyltransferase [bacterium SCSIO 12643]
MRLVLNAIQILLIWILTLLSAILGLVILPFVGQKKSIWVSSKIWSVLVLGVSGVKIEVEGVENIPTDQHVIYTSNHESAFDIPILFKTIPVPLFFLAKAELKKIPVFGWYVEAVGMVFVDRKNHQNAMESLKKAGREIKKGKDIITFPEGTRPRDGQMKLFKRGSFILALENEINMVPVAIIGSKYINPPGYKIRPGKVTVKIGKIVDVSEFDVNKPDVLAKHIEDQVREMYGIPVRVDV